MRQKLTHVAVLDLPGMIEGLSDLPGLFQALVVYLSVYVSRG